MTSPSTASYLTSTISRIKSGKVWNESDSSDHLFLNDQPFPKAWTYEHNHEHEANNRIRIKRDIPAGPAYQHDEDYVEDDYRGDKAFKFIFRSHTNGRILPEEGHSIVKRFVPIVLVAVGALITVFGTAIGAETIARGEGDKVRREVFTTAQKYGENIK